MSVISAAGPMLGLLGGAALLTTTAVVLRNLNGTRPDRLGTAPVGR